MKLLLNVKEVEALYKLFKGPRFNLTEDEARYVDSVYERMQVCEALQVLKKTKPQTASERREMIKEDMKVWLIFTNQKGFAREIDAVGYAIGRFGTVDKCIFKVIQELSCTGWLMEE